MHLSLQVIHLLFTKNKKKKLSEGFEMTEKLE